MPHSSTKLFELGSCAFRQPRADSHCRWLHGYRLTAKVWFEADELDSNNWVMDFGGLKELKKSFENRFDHTTVISSDDPALELFRQLNEEDVIDLRVSESGVGIEKFAQWIYNATETFLVHYGHNPRVRVTKVEVFEHEKNSAIYER